MKLFATSHLKLLFYVSTLLLLSQRVVADTPQVANQAGQEPSPQEIRRQAVELARTGGYAQALGMLEKALRLTDYSPEILSDYIVVLSWSGNAQEAIKQYESMPVSYSKPFYVISAAAKCYRNEKQLKKAVSLYQSILAKQPGNLDAIRGLVLTLVDAKQYEQAFDLVEKALSQHPDNIDLLFAKASVHWRKRDYITALKVYDHILGIMPGNHDAINLKARLLSDMGCVSLALEFANDHLAIIDPEVLYILECNMAADRIAWNEPDLAVNILDRLIREEPKPFERLRLRFDRILALRKMEEMEQIVEAYNELVSENVEIPYWIHEAAGDAFLYLKQPEKAIQLYEKVIKARPTLFNPRMALYDAYIDRGDFKKAGQILDELEQETPEWIWDRGVLRYNWNREAVAVAKGWWLAYQDRLQESEKYFLSLLAKAPANLSLRTGLGQVHLWRGWPHEALEDFDIIITMGSDDSVEKPSYLYENEIAAKNSRVAALNECFFKQEARDCGKALLARNPCNLHTQYVNRQLDIEDSTEFVVDTFFTKEYPGAREYDVSARVIQPVCPLLDVYCLGLRRETSEKGEETVTYNRGGVGANFDIHPQLTLAGDFTMEVDSGDDIGVLGRLVYRATDCWLFDVSHNSFSLDVPLRARAAGIKANTSELNARYRTSELFLTRASAALQDYDDGNEHGSFMLIADRALITRAYIKTRLLGEIEGGFNSETDVSYFSPDYDFSFTLTHLIDHTLFRRYDQAFVHRLYLGAGAYNQAHYNPQFIWHARYEQDYLISDKTVLLWGIVYNRRFYDAEKTDIFMGYLTFGKHF